MSETIAGQKVKHEFKPSFFFWMTVVMSVFVFGGFGLTYWRPMFTNTLPSLPPVIHVHGLAYTFWMVLLMTQAYLINVRSIALHRTLGTFGIAMAGVLLVTGFVITALFGKHMGVDPSSDYLNLMYLSWVAILSFACLFTLAIRHVRQPENHKRLILFACIPLLPPGINRLYMVSLGLTELPLLATYLTMDAMVIAILAYDWRNTGKLGTASMIGASFVFLQQILHVPVVNSDTFEEVNYLLSHLAQYR
jgi:hypothetical protein